MAQVLVRNLPDDVLAGLRQAAAEDGLSLEEFLRRTLEDAAHHRGRWRAFVAEAASRLSAQPRRRTGASARSVRADRGR